MINEEILMSLYNILDKGRQKYSYNLTGYIIYYNAFNSNSILDCNIYIKYKWLYGSGHNCLKRHLFDLYNLEKKFNIKIKCQLIKSYKDLYFNNPSYIILDQYIKEK